MSKYDILLTAMAVVFCCWATYTDLKNGKIKNICSIGLMYAGIIKQVILLIVGEITIGKALSAFILGGIIAFGAYWIGILAAGDAKLYWGVEMILPYSIWEQNSSVIAHPALIMLINMFIVYLVYIIIYTLIKHIKLRKSSIIPDIWQVKGVIEKIPGNIMLFFKFLAVLLCVQYITFILKMNLGFYQFLISLAIYYSLKYLFKKFHVHSYISYVVYYIPAIIILILNPSVLQIYWKMLLFWAIIYQLALPIVISYGLKMDGLYFSESVQIEDLKQGMIPGEQIIRVITDTGIMYKKEPAVASSIYDKNVLVSPISEGLSEEQVQTLKGLSFLGYFERFDNTLMIQRPMHFAPMILSGLIITLVCGGPFHL